MGGFFVNWVCTKPAFVNLSKHVYAYVITRLTQKNVRVNQTGSRTPPLVANIIGSCIGLARDCERDLAQDLYFYFCRVHKYIAALHGWLARPLNIQYF